MGWFEHVYTQSLTSELDITPDMLRAAVPRIKEPHVWALALNEAWHEFGIKGPLTWAMFLAQVGHESVSFSRLEENLNYSAARLKQVWPRRFPTIAAAKPYAHNPVGLAGKVYGGRMGNKQPMDGWHFRGRGPIMTTGRANYEKASQYLGLDLVARPELLKLPEHGARAAAAYWVERVDNPHSLEQTTYDINGGYNGLKDRQRRFNIALAALAGLRK